MSQRIEHILEIIEEVHDEFQNADGFMPVTDMRRKAVASVAHRRGITTHSVRDTFIRQLRPYTELTAGFDKLLEDWLVHDSVELKNIMLKKTKDPKDTALINSILYKAPESDILLAQEFGYDPNEEPYKEGRAQFRLHLTKERNRSLVNRAKKLWNKQQDGQARCSICSFSFPETYGTVGEGFIEAHHTKPISSLASDTVVTLTDLVPICSNCHTMLHRHRPWLTVEELHIILSKQKGNP
jgi:hypothetical protein